jgi:PPOX class probable F420-dependent enzyme
MDLIKDETRAFAVLATLSANGIPQATPIWFNTDGDTFVINSAVGRLKDLNMRARPPVALAILDPKNPYRYLQVRGKVTEITVEGADEHIHTLSMKYTGHRYSIPQGEVRVSYRITPTRIAGQG